MLSDPWLQRWLALAKQRAAGLPALEIGCGYGEDTSVLAATGFDVVAFDISRAAVAVARARVPSAQIFCRDIRDPLPLAPQGAGLVVASLSLHYFAEAQTRSIFIRIHEVLQPGGLLLCRLNSTQDRHFGARGGHRELEPDFFLVNGRPKHFFCQAAASALFADRWNLLSLEQKVTCKYIVPKVLWEAVAARD